MAKPSSQSSVNASSSSSGEEEEEQGAASGEDQEEEAMPKAKQAPKTPRSKGGGTRRRAKLHMPLFAHVSVHFQGFYPSPVLCLYGPLTAQGH